MDSSEDHRCRHKKGLTGARQGGLDTQPRKEGTGPAVEEARELHMQYLHRHSHIGCTLDSLNNVDRSARNRKPPPRPPPMLHNKAMALSPNLWLALTPPLPLLLPARTGAVHLQVGWTPLVSAVSTHRLTGMAGPLQAPCDRFREQNCNCQKTKPITSASVIASKQLHHHPSI